MHLGDPVEAPWGFVTLCNRSPVDCVNQDTPQARANAALAARQIAAERWGRALQSAADHQAPATPEAAAALNRAPAPDPRAARNWPPPPLSRAEPATPDPAAALNRAPAPEPRPAPDWPPPPLDRAMTAPSAGVALDTSTLASLRRVNAHVNAAITPARDEQVYGVRDWWAAPLSSGGPPYGDCKDYALEKRRELIASGLPPSALSIALVRTREGDLHAVLVVATNRGDMVLDNLNPEIRRWDATGYSWQARQSAADPMVWLAVRN